MSEENMVKKETAAKKRAASASVLLIDSLSTTIRNILIEVVESEDVYQKAIKANGETDYDNHEFIVQIARNTDSIITKLITMQSDLLVLKGELYKAGLTPTKHNTKA